MTILSVVYASAPATEVLIPTIEIQVPGLEPIRICAGFENHLLGVDSEMVEFEAAAISVALPKRDTSGRQALQFVATNANGRDQRYIDAALEADEPVTLIYREYLASDKSAPAKRPLVMVVNGGQLEGFESRFEAAFYDLLNSAWPRDRYTAETAPGLRYL